VTLGIGDEVLAGRVRAVRLVFVALLAAVFWTGLVVVLTAAPAFASTPHAGPGGASADLLPLPVAQAAAEPAHRLPAALGVRPSSGPAGTAHSTEPTIAGTAHSTEPTIAVAVAPAAADVRIVVSGAPVGRPDVSRVLAASETLRLPELGHARGHLVPRLIQHPLVKRTVAVAVTRHEPLVSSEAPRRSDGPAAAATRGSGTGVPARHGRLVAESTREPAACAPSAGASGRPAAGAGATGHGSARSLLWAFKSWPGDPSRSRSGTLSASSALASAGAGAGASRVGDSADSGARLIFASVGVLRQPPPLSGRPPYGLDSTPD
jgi:hypothetical protein